MHTLEAPVECLERARRPQLDLQQLETFRVVAATRNFTRAAVELGYCQSSVTTQIKALEKELGVELLERHRFSRNVVLTEAGQRILTYAVRLHALVDETKAAVHDVGKETVCGRSHAADFIQA